MFPENIKYLDAATFTEEYEDVAIKPGEMEGGYTLSRPRFTRAPRRTWTFKFVEMRDADKEALANHWKAVKGRSNMFQWRHPISGEIVQVRYGEMTMRFSRTGFGPLNVWQSDVIVLNEI